MAKKSKKGVINWLAIIIFLSVAFVVLIFVIFPTLQNLYDISKKITELPPEKSQIEIETEGRMIRIVDFISAKIEEGVDSKDNLCKIKLAGIHELEKGWEISFSEGTDKLVIELKNDKGQIVKVESIPKLVPCYVGNQKAVDSFNNNLYYLIDTSRKSCTAENTCVVDYATGEFSLNGEKMIFDGKEQSLIPALYKSFDNKVCFFSINNEVDDLSKRIALDIFGKIKECK
ncbi:MAG TPA: hypothetical protein VI894_02470 [Candidatus Nanoarchaeia archaeon]|nr:hypothetical protein [Candidatus Nanoarchaeia archaeon]